MTTRNNEQPVLVLVAGPNGAGKTTLVSGLDLSLPVINADTIMLESRCTPIQAGRQALSRLHEHVRNGVSCIHETTLSGRGIFKLLELARQHGFFLALHYIGLDSAELAVERVNTRFASGQGHDVLEQDVRRRYERSLENLPRCIRECDLAILYDNAGVDRPFEEIFRKQCAMEPIVYMAEALPAWALHVIEQWRKTSK